MDAARDGRVMVLTGPPGIGKTSLAIAWGHRARTDFPDGALFADLHGPAPDGPAAPSEILGRFLRALAVDPSSVSADLAEQTAVYRSLMIDKRMLVVLDDALTAAQVFPLLPSGPESVTIITSRSRLGGLAARGARVIQVGGLDADAAFELLARTIGDERVEAEGHATRKLVELCARLPLALCVAGARLAARPRWPVTEMVDAMRHERERLAALTMEGDMAVQSALDISYASLSGDAARLYRLMGLFPGTHFDSTVAAAAAALPRAEAKRLLGTLADANLLDDIARGKYEFHALTRLHAREKAEREEPATTRDKAILRMLDWYLDTVGAACRRIMPYRKDLVLDIRYPPSDSSAFADSGAALEWLDQELPNIMAAARLAASHHAWSVTWQLADAAWPVFLHRGHYAERLDFDRLGLEAARADGSAFGEAKMLYNLGISAMNAGQLDEAETSVRQAMPAWENLGQRDRVAGSQRRLGFIEMARRRPNGAIVWFTQALATYRDLDSTRHVALTLIDLADAFMETGIPDDAVAALEEAAALLADSDDPHNRARVQIRLGRAHIHAGRLDASAGHLHQGLTAMREIGSGSGEAEALTALGELAVRSGQPDEARALYTKAHQLLVSLGSPKKAGVAERLEQLDQP